MKLSEIFFLLTGAVLVSGLLGCAPGQSPGGYGPACGYQMARGFKDGSEGYFIVTVLFEYVNGVLINVQDFERFLPDGKFGES